MVRPNLVYIHKCRELGRLKDWVLNALRPLNISRGLKRLTRVFIELYCALELRISALEHALVLLLIADKATEKLKGHRDVLS